ncbi:MAG: hypothetical protein E7337_03500 [Clostridiales bacterium]|nr:hypothetical protein [Clostridiales bacterium]
MFPIKEFEKRLREIVEAMDDIQEDAELDEDTLEELAELNAESEDALMLLSEIGPDDEDAEEALEDAVDEFSALCDDYRALGESIPGIALQVQRLEKVVEMMRVNL